MTAKHRVRKAVLKNNRKERDESRNRPSDAAEGTAGGSSPRYRTRTGDLSAASEPGEQAETKRGVDTLYLETDELTENQERIISSARLRSITINEDGTGFIKLAEDGNTQVHPF